jgi:antitoxin component YwqK of YwqJK toxin-antitoxin module
MHKLIFILFLLSTSVVFAQGEYNKTDAQDRKQGTWRKFYDKAEKQVRYEGQFKDDIPVGTFFYYYETGKVMAKNTYRGTTGVSYSKMYNETNVLIAEGKYIGQERDSIWRIYSDNGAFIAEEAYAKGIKHGVWATYFKDGSLTERTEFVNGLKEGEWLQRYENGKNRAKGIYKADKLNGECTYWDEIGNITEKGTYQNGLKHGNWLVYEDGRAKTKEVWKHGNLIRSVEL